jgi:hypothetical protein
LEVRRLCVGDQVVDFNLVRRRDSVQAEVIHSRSISIVVQGVGRRVTD